MVPSTTRMPPPKRAGPQLFTSPVPKPPTMIGAGAPPPPRPPKKPPPPAAQPGRTVRAATRGDTRGDPFETQILHRVGVDQLE